MAWFRRKSTTEIPELKEFYDNEKTERPLVAWTLALVSLLTTVMVVTALFFGGRWIYGRINTDNKQPVPAITEDQNDAQGTLDEDDANTQATPEAGGVVDAPVSTPATSTSTTSTTTTTLPNTGPSDSEL